MTSNCFELLKFTVNCIEVYGEQVGNKGRKSKARWDFECWRASGKMRAGIQDLDCWSDRLASKGILVDSSYTWTKKEEWNQDRT